MLVQYTGWPDSKGVIARRLVVHLSLSVCCAVSLRRRRRRERRRSRKSDDVTSERQSRLMMMISHCAPQSFLGSSLLAFRVQLGAQLAQQVIRGQWKREEPKSQFDCAELCWHFHEVA